MQETTAMFAMQATLSENCPSNSSTKFQSTTPKISGITGAPTQSKNYKATTSSNGIYNSI